MERSAHDPATARDAISRLNDEFLLKDIAELGVQDEATQLRARLERLLPEGEAAATHKQEADQRLRACAGGDDGACGQVVGALDGRDLGAVKRAAVALARNLARPAHPSAASFDPRDWLKDVVNRFGQDDRMRTREIAAVACGAGNQWACGMACDRGEGGSCFAGCRAGGPLFCHALAQRLATGGYNRDLQLSAALLTRACDLGTAGACRDLAAKLREGRDGIAADAAAARALTCRLDAAACADERAREAQARAQAAAAAKQAERDAAESASSCGCLSWRGERVWPCTDQDGKLQLTDPDAEPDTSWQSARPAEGEDPAATAALRELSRQAGDTIHGYEQRADQAEQSSAACPDGDDCCKAWEKINASGGALGAGKVPAC